MSTLSKRFLMLTFAIMAVCWGGCVIFGLFGIGLSNFPVLYLPYMLGGLSPTIAAYIALKREGRIRGFREWLKITFDFRHSFFAYLLLPIFAGAFFLVLCLVCSFEKGAPLPAVFVMIPMMLFGGGLEEAGWRGILQPELEKRFGFVKATLLVAVIWWFWHAPLFLIPGVSQYGGDFLSFGINVLGLSFALAAIRLATGSTWLCVLMHCLINSLHGVYIIHENRLGNAAAAAVLILMSWLLLQFPDRKRLFGN